MENEQVGGAYGEDSRELGGVGGMRCHWPRRPLSSAAVEIIDGDRGKEYPKHSDFYDSGYCLFLNTGNVRPYHNPKVL
jgi:hypothetical protein